MGASGILLKPLGGLFGVSWEPLGGLELRGSGFERRDSRGWRRQRRRKRRCPRVPWLKPSRLAAGGSPPRAPPRPLGAMAVGAVGTGAMYDASPSQLGLPAVALARGYVAPPYQQGLRAEGYPMRDSSENYATREVVFAVVLEGYRVFGSASAVGPKAWLPQFDCLSVGVAVVVVAIARAATTLSTAM